MNEAVVVSYRYDPYGKVTITRGGTPQSSDPLGNHWTFTGRFLDEESGLLYYRARYYDPTTGRFLQRDPEGYAQGPNLFAYCGNNPPSLTDPSGRWWIVVVIIICIIADDVGESPGELEAMRLREAQERNRRLREENAAKWERLRQLQEEKAARDAAGK